MPRNQTELKIVEQPERVEDARPAAVLRPERLEPDRVGLRVALQPGRRLDQHRADEAENGEGEDQDEAGPHRDEEVPEALTEVGRARRAGRRRGRRTGSRIGPADRRGRAVSVMIVSPQRPRGANRPDSRANVFVIIRKPTTTSIAPVTSGDGPVVVAQPAEAVAHGRGADRDEDERDGQAGRVGDEEDGALGDARADRGEADDAAEDRTDARRPAGGEDDAEEGRPPVARGRRGRAAPKPIEAPPIAPTGRWTSR